MKLLITGGAGYIGSVTNRYLTQKGIETIVFDNLSTGRKQAVEGSQLVVGDLCNAAQIDAVMEKGKFDAVIHFAAMALAGESMEKPSEYYRNNILGGINLLDAMRKANCNTIIFSSTCAVYGYPDTLPVSEEESYKPVSVYGSSKRIFEEVLEWYQKIFGIQYAFLRYFNAAGAWSDGTLGEAHPKETHIIPIALDVALGKKKAFQIFGNDYDTPDGTCIRDYIHVLDLAEAHALAVEHVRSTGKSLVANLGVGKGYSNMEILKSIESVTGKKLPVEIVERRPGDPDRIFADNTRARTVLGWTPKHSDIQTIVASAWEWHRRMATDGGV
jgi:UDP-glucose 4-epimerase